MEPSARGSEPWVGIKQELVSWHGTLAYSRQEAGTVIYFSMIFVFQVTLLANLLVTNLR